MRTFSSHLSGLSEPRTPRTADIWYRLHSPKHGCCSLLLLPSVAHPHGLLTFLADHPLWQIQKNAADEQVHTKNSTQRKREGMKQSQLMPVRSALYITVMPSSSIVWTTAFAKSSAVLSSSVGDFCCCPVLVRSDNLKRSMKRRLHDHDAAESSAPCCPQSQLPRVAALESTPTRRLHASRSSTGSARTLLQAIGPSHDVSGAPSVASRGTRSLPATGDLSTLKYACACFHRK